MDELKQYIKEQKLDGIEIRGKAIRIRFSYRGTQRNETLKGLLLTRANLT
ncbi:Arm DNA-binding domain-containing protein [Shewanella surugensis]|nr:DUF3596 domain-containing protein [Shewanella surugensis]